MKLRTKLLGLLLIGSSLVGTMAAADNSGVAIFPEATRPAAVSYIAGPYTNFSWRGVKLYLRAKTKVGSDPTLDCKVQDQDPVSGLWFDVTGASFAQVTSTVTPTPLSVYPGLTAVTNVAVTQLLPRVWRVNCTVGPGTASSATGFVFSMGGSLQQ